MSHKKDQQMANNKVDYTTPTSDNKQFVWR